MRAVLFNILLAFSFFASAQNYIGMQKDEIIKVMQKERPGFKFEKNAVNRSYNMIKFVDKTSEQTMLFFLSEKNICTYVRWMSDYSNLTEIISELDRLYKKKDERTWYYSDKNQDYVVRLEEGEWFFTISIRKK
ncbi:MAG: hypothetical protein H6R34_793 [Bacteroidetes bacterium]|jgi:hypothetical protein|nr:hypothetical protein [Bacteroidota bacterium]